MRKKRASCKINGIGYPTADRISGRSSTLARSMACTLTTREPCRPEQEEQWVAFFPDKACAYCGNTTGKLELDHLYPLVMDGFPTGYGTDPTNLVPCCVKCNGSKGNRSYEEYMRGDKCPHEPDPETGSVEEAKERRIQVIQRFQAAMPAKKVEISDEVKQEFKALLDSFKTQLTETEQKLDALKRKIFHP